MGSFLFPLFFHFHIEKRKKEEIKLNTKIMYLYRDASNYKKYSEEVVAGELDSDQERQIKESLFEG